MKVDILLGLQWGDEGKGKIVDVLSDQYDIIARFQGGPNAGHTVEFDGNKYVLHTIPSGIFNKQKMNLIGNGVIIDPLIFSKEIHFLEEKGIYPASNLMISQRAHLILPTHRLLDAALENSKGKAKIGSTVKGIGPTYTDKIARHGIRIGDIFRSEFSDMCNHLRDQHLRMVEMLGFDSSTFKPEGLTIEEYEKQWIESLDILKKFKIIAAEYFINESLDAGMKVLAEGAQGTLLDVEFGSYPFVTSSNTISAGACTGLGIAPSKIGKVMGVFKAYCTRVGSGPFPTELIDDIGENMRKAGNEFGSTTGRPRRCGWLDMPALKYAIMLNGVNELIMMKADVLDNFESIKVCTGYESNGQEITHLPFDTDDLKPLYIEKPGWKISLSEINSESGFPINFSEYIQFIETETKVRIKAISTGPDRTQTVFRNI